MGICGSKNKKGREENEKASSSAEAYKQEEPPKPKFHSSLQNLQKVSGDTALKQNITFHSRKKVSVEFEQVSDEGIKSFASQLDSLEEINHLLLIFKNCPQVSNLSIKWIQDSLFRKKNIDYLYLDFNGCGTGVTKQQVCNLFASTRKMESSMFIVENELFIIGKQYPECLMPFDLTKINALFLQQNHFRKNSSKKENFEKLNVFFKSIAENLQKLTLQFGYAALTDEHLSLVLDGLFDCCGQLEELQINFLDNSDLTKKGYQCMMNECSKLKKVSFMKLDFAQCKGMDDETIKEIGNISVLGQLKKMQLIVSSNPQLTDNGIQNIASNIIPKLNSCTDFGLDAANMEKISDAGVSKVAQVLSKQSQLRDLSFKLSLNSGISGKGLLQDIGKAQNLENLEVDISYCKQINDEGLSDMFSQIGSCIKLKSLCVNLNNMESLGTPSLKAISSGLVGGSQSLEDLKLTFSWSNKIPAEGYQSLLEGISKLSHLKSLELAASIPDISTLLQLSETLNNLKSLNKLILKIESSNDISKGLKQFCTEGIKRLGDRLTYLRLSLNALKGFGDEHVGLLGASVGSLEKLEFLELNIANTWSLTNSGLEKLANGIIRLSKLNFFILHLQNNKKIDEKPILQFNPLPSLKDFELNVVNCGFDLKVIQKIENAFEKCQRISILW